MAAGVGTSWVTGAAVEAWVTGEGEASESGGRRDIRCNRGSRYIRE